nr:AI-2E family transporter [uncultured Halomonas sp.]
MESPKQRRYLSEYSRRVWIAAGVAVAVLALLMLLWSSFEILLIGFAGLLLALFFSLPANWLCRHSFLSQRWSLLVVLTISAGLLAAFSLNFALSISQEFAQLSKVLPGALEGLEQWLHGWPFGSQIIEQIEQSQPMQRIFDNWSARVSLLFTTTFGMLFNVIVILFIGLFVAFEPALYRAGLIRLVAPSRRGGAVDLLEAIGRKMTWWLVGRLVSMTTVGLLAGSGLWLLGIPMALSLGLLAGLLSFIPYLGPILGAVPALLVAFTQDATAMLHVGLLYTAVQILESYLVTPLVQREAVSIPPALLLIVQVWLGLFAGLMGLLLAEPLIVLSMVMIQRLYVQGWLERNDSPSEQAAGEADGQ